MKKSKIVKWIIPGIIVVGILFFMLMAHGDEQVSGVSLTDSPIADIEVLDGINSTKGTDTAGFTGVLYVTSTAEFASYTYTDIAPIPEGKPLYANVRYIASPKGMPYTAIWKRGGETIKEETKEITVDTSREAISYMLDGSLLEPGEYTLEIFYREKQLYTQTFKVG